MFKPSGLPHGPPFASRAAGASSFFCAATQRKALSYIGYALAQGVGMVIVTGAAGLGKTALAAHILRSAGSDKLTAAQIDGAAVDRTGLIPAVARAFGVAAGADKALGLAAARRFLHAEACAGRRCVLVIDDAHALAPESLADLVQLADLRLGAHCLLQVVLLARPCFAARLEHGVELAPLRQMVVAWHELEPLAPGEVGAYIAHRLARADWKGRLGFDPEVHAGISAATNGVPARINPIVGRLVRLSAARRHARIDCALLVEVLRGSNAGSEQAVSHGVTEAAPFLSPKADEQLARDRFDEAMRRIADLEARTLAQEQALHRVVALLVEWIEGAGAPRVDA